MKILRLLVLCVCIFVGYGIIKYNAAKQYNQVYILRIIQNNKDIVNARIILPIKINAEQYGPHLYYGADIPVTDAYNRIYIYTTETGTKTCNVKGLHTIIVTKENHD
jgi:hypothetical protein